MDKMNTEESKENSAEEARYDAKETGYDGMVTSIAGLSYTYFQVFPYKPRSRHRHDCYWLPEPVSDSEIASYYS